MSAEKYFQMIQPTSQTGMLACTFGDCREDFDLKKSVLDSDLPKCGKPYSADRISDLQRQRRITAKIQQGHCLHSGKCKEICPLQAIERSTL